MKLRIAWVEPGIKKMAESKKRIIDVQHPNKSAPSGNSKSVIVTNRPILKDPMVVDEPKETIADLQKKGANKIELEIPDASKLTVDKLVEAKEKHKAEKADADKPEPKDESEDKAKAEEPKEDEPTKHAERLIIEPPKDSVASDDEMPKSESANPASASDDTPSEIATDDETDDKSKSKADVDNKLNEVADREAAKTKHDQEVEKLVESKKYFLPINSVEKRRSKRVVAFGVVLSILLIVAWLDIALDAGLVKLGGLKPLTHFF